MLKLLLSIALFFSTSYGVSFTYPDFKQCYKKNLKSFVYFGNIKAVAISKYLAVAYLKTKPKRKYEKYDPLLNLYLFRSKEPLNAVKLRSSNKLKIGEWIAGMDEDALYVGNYATSDDIYDSIYLPNAKLSPSSIISCLCCDVYGLGIEGGKFVGSEFIKRLINSKERIIKYGDIGVEFKKIGKNFVVKEVLDNKQPLKVGDRIVSINGKMLNSIKQLRRAILFSKPGVVLKVKYFRGKALIESDIKVKDRFLDSGFYSKKFGIKFDKNLKIIDLKKTDLGYRSGLRVGDKILSINGKRVKNVEKIKEYFKKSRDKKIELLIDRDDFQFFVYLGV